MFMNMLQDFVNLYKQDPSFAFIILLVILATLSFFLKFINKLLLPVLIIIGILYLCGGINTYTINNYNKKVSSSPIGSEINNIIRSQN